MFSLLLKDLISDFYSSCSHYVHSLYEQKRKADLQENKYTTWILCLWVTDRLDMTLAVDRAVKPQHKQNKFCHLFEYFLYI